MDQMKAFVSRNMFMLRLGRMNSVFQKEWCGKNATIYFILPVKNQGKWVHHFTSQLANMSRQSGDLGFHVIIVDFDSEDIDIDEAFSVWPLQDRYTLIKLSGPFYKTLAIQKAVQAVPHDDDIVFLFDLHIDVPIGLLDSVRKVRFEDAFNLLVRVYNFEIVSGRRGLKITLTCKPGCTAHRLQGSLSLGFESPVALFSIPVANLLLCHCG